MRVTRPCEARDVWPTVCTGAATDRHHVIPRSRGGPDDPRNLADLCHRCHMHAHANPAAATAAGLLDSPAACTACHRRMTALEWLYRTTSPDGPTHAGACPP